MLLCIIVVIAASVAGVKHPSRPLPYATGRIEMTPGTEWGLGAVANAMACAKARFAGFYIGVDKSPGR